MKVQFDIPRIETERLILRGIGINDLDAFAAINADEEVKRFLGGVSTRLQSWKILTSTIGHWALRGFGMFAVEEKSSGQFVGLIGPLFHDGYPENEIGYVLARSVHGKGYGTEAAMASLKYAYETLGWTTAISLIDPLNIASQGVATKLGATKEQVDVAVADFRADIWRHLPPHEFMEKHG